MARLHQDVWLDGYAACLMAIDAQVQRDAFDACVTTLSPKDRRALHNWLKRERPALLKYWPASPHSERPDQ